MDIMNKTYPKNLKKKVDHYTFHPKKEMKTENALTMPIKQ